MMRSFIRLTAAAVLIALAGQVFAAQAGAQVLGQWDRPESRIDVSATRWNPGSPMTLRASHFSSNEVVNVTFDGSDLATQPVNGSGSFELNATVPTKAPGTYRVVATGQQSGRVAEFYYSVQAFNPWGEPSGYWVPVGRPLTFTGHRFGNGETVDVMLDGAIVASESANSEGEFSNAGPYVVPRSKFGQQLTFKLVGQTSGASTTFGVGVANWPPLPNEPANPVDPVDPTEPNDPAAPSLLTSALVPSLAGESRWQSLEWKGGDYDVCDFEATANPGSGSVATYPSGQSASYPSANRTLSSKETDFTAIRFRLSNDASNKVSVAVQAKYRPCDSTNFKTADFTVDFPVRTPGDPALRQVSNEVGAVNPNSSTWVQVDFAADGPGVTDVRVAAGAPAGVEVYYPAERSYTTPARETWIDSGTQDCVGMRLDVANLAPGVYVIPLKATFGSPSQTADYSISVVVN